MTVYIGADHRGYELKNKLLEYLQEKNIRAEDMGNYEYSKEDDYVDYAAKVVQAVLQHPAESRGVVICGSGVGVCIAANRHKGIRCALGFNEKQIQHARQNDNVNVLALPSEYIDSEQAKDFLNIFLETQAIVANKYLRRERKLDM